MKFIVKVILLVNIYSRIFCHLQNIKHTHKNHLLFIYIKNHNFILNTKKLKKNDKFIRQKSTFLSSSEYEQNDGNVNKKQNNTAGSIKFYDFSHIYKHYNIEKKNKQSSSTNDNQEGVNNIEPENVSDIMNDKIINNQNNNNNNNNNYNNRTVYSSNEESLNIEENNSYTQSSSDTTNNKNNSLLVKDDPNRIQKVIFENVYDYSSIFKDKEKKPYVKTYVANVFQKMPKFKDNTKVIKDALLYLKFIEKGNLYLIKNVDKKSVNAEPYDDFSNKKKKKGTKKDKIKLELTSIYNNINKEKHTKKRICKECCIKIDLYTKLLSRPLNNIYNMHRNLKKFLHPFQYSLYENTVTNLYKDGDVSNSLSDVLNNILEVRKLITSTGKMYAGQLKYLKTCREIFRTLNEAIVDLNIILQSGRKWLDIYNSYIKKIRKIKYIDITKPAISIIGCTNVGKSSLLNSITNSKSKVANYNFTTKELNLGHYSFANDNDIFTTQIMDLPGLIDRPEDKRNIMEKLSLSSLKNIPSAVIYVFDPLKKDDHKFASLKSQIDIRYYLRGLFPFRPWIDVITKSDLINFDQVQIPNDIKQNALFLSTEYKPSLLPLKEKINEVTFKLNNFLNKHMMES
ncbi:GTP-binding protein, putative [Plasmodium reichenowi]|uniref:GTP-binding protein, putative n=1 Tax=Plasmodium reichenowi TaxID=5854 RepID=A0A151LSG5_PLARE|nr:GTP-binding protein, putative [Plasmodium reichenowi]KYO02112.1 GTP-binding protein, putative [Plasmodium reichenowi]